MASTQTPETETPEDDAGAVATRQLLLFGAGGRVYGCDVGAVREIIPFRRCTRLPGSPPYVCGLTNLRGTVVTVIDLAARLGVSRTTEAHSAEERDGGSIIMAEHGTKVVGMAVDGVHDVQVIADDALEAPEGAESTGDAAHGGGVVSGLGQLGGDVVIVLDVQTILRQVLA